MILDDLDRRVLAAFTEDYSITPDGETGVISSDIKIKLTRTEADRYELLIEFANLQFPIAMLRGKTLASLNIEDDVSQ
jgi:hypothetical protein